MLQFLAPEVSVLNAVAQTCPDIILIETSLSNGFEQYTALKQHSHWQAPPLLLLVHEPVEDVIKWGHDVSADERFFLPGTAHELLIRVQSLLRHAGGQKPGIHFGSRVPKKSMLRGFVHEISNALTSKMLVLATAFDQETTLSLHNTKYLHQLFELIEPLLTQELREKVLEYLHRIDQNEETLDRVLRLVNDANERAICNTRLISEYAKLEYLPMKIQPLMLDQELAIILKQYHEHFESQDITVTVDGTCSYPFLGHQPHIRSLFEHLLKNAYEAFVSHNSSPSQQLHITFAETEKNLRITIRDNAGGIQPEHLPEVFEPFYTTKSNSHAGMGLCFAAKLVSLYRGNISLNSTPEEGTTVTIDLPLQAATSSDSAENT